MKNLTEKVKAFFTAFWKWLTYSTLPIKEMSDDEYYKSLSEYLNYKGISKETFYDGFFNPSAFRTAYYKVSRKKRKSEKKKLRTEMKFRLFSIFSK